MPHCPCHLCRATPLERDQIIKQAALDLLVSKGEITLYEAEMLRKEERERVKGSTFKPGFWQQRKL